MALSQLELTQKPFIELQIEALAHENQIRSKRAKKFIEDLGTRMKEIKELNLEKLLNRNFRLPLVGRPNSLNDDDYPKVSKFHPPKHFQAIGGYTTKTALRRTNYIDLAVQMPARCFERKDVKNQRYHHKRALYLAQLARLLNGPTGFGLVDKVEFCFHRGDPLKPVIILTPKSAILKKAHLMFQLFAVPEADAAIKMSLLHPAHGNVAPKWFFAGYQFNESTDEIKQFVESDSHACPSPLYNSGILFDIEAIANSDIISEHIKPKTTIAEALLLTKIWLFQRELHQHFSFPMSMLVTYLLTKQKIHQNMSSYQIFKVIIRTLIEQDWANEGLSFFEDSIEKLATFKTIFPVVFLSPSGHMNLCYNITIDLYERLKHEAKIAMDIFMSGLPETFELLFLKRLDFVNKFDVIVHLPKVTRKLPEVVSQLKQFLDLGAVSRRLYSDCILDLVHRSLTDRVTLVQQNPNQLLLEGKWSTRGIPYDPSKQSQHLSLGLLLDAEKSLRVIDVGPDAQSLEAEEFRKFWEPKSQLRLQNGVISETVVWHLDSFSQRRAIIKYILTHALKKANISRVVVHYTLLERFIDLKNVHFQWRDDLISQNENRETRMLLKRKHEEDDQMTQGKPIGVGEEIFQKVLSSYNDLNKILRSVANLRHAITSIQPTSHHLRASGVFPPLPVSVQPRNKSLKRRKGVTLIPNDFKGIGKVFYIEPVEILVTLDASSKWPGELEALEAEKLDILIKMGEELKSRGYCIKFSEDYLDVLHGQFVFRVRVRCQKELTLVVAARGKLELQRRRLAHEILPRIHGALDQLYREQPAFSLTCRLVKRWISCHLMTSHINDITLDLIVAHLFLHPQPYTEPASSACGFKRFLELLSTHDWQDSPLVVNFDNQLKVDEVNRIKTVMQSERDNYPALVICTPFDRDRPSPWTREEPNEGNLELLVKICTKALEYFTSGILCKLDVLDECRALFRPNFKLFDLIIKLDPQTVQTFFMSIDPPKRFEISGKESSDKQASAFKVMPIVGLNVVEQFVSVLRTKFNDLAQFHYDRYGQRIIGVVMRPESEKLLEGDMQGFIRDIKKVGAKLVESVSLKSG